MTTYRDFKSLTADPTAGTVYARLADIHEDAVQAPAAPRSGFAAVGIRAAVQRFVSANPEYTGPAALRF